MFFNSDNSVAAYLFFNFNCRKRKNLARKMNKSLDEAYRCIQTARKAITDGNLERAETLLLKAENLYPTQSAKDLLVKVRNRLRHGEGSTESRREGFYYPRTTSASPTGARTTLEIDYTADQLEAVRSIKKCKDYYEVLAVSKEASDAEIKKAYKKLALQLHPDKNKAPGAVEAFKAVGNAVAILTDPEKRKSYDLEGGEENVYRSSHVYTRRHYSADYSYSRGFEPDVTAEELFNMFFGSGFSQQNTYGRQRRFHRSDHHHQREQQPSYAALINLVPILLLIGLSMMSSIFISDPVYSLQPSQKYSILRKTSVLNVPYYVKDSFNSEYQGSVGRLEASVEEDYVNHLRHACSRERTYRDALTIQAQTFGDSDLYRKAQNLKTPACDKLLKLLNS